MDIEFKEGSVCFALGHQWSDGDKLPEDYGNGLVTAELTQFIVASDFQLNTLKQGDYIEASELDTEQKYDDAVEVFKLFGFERVGEFCLGYTDFMAHPNESALICSDWLLMGISKCHSPCKRKLTYPQLMAIGKLKWAMIELDVKNDVEMMTDKMNSATGKSVDKAEKLGDEWTDKHYNNFYQLNEEDIKVGKIKVDAYFVNRMWKINQWDDTGAGFHIVKTLPRIANNKNPLKRELVALKKQVDILCKLHGVDDDNTN